MRVVYGDEEDAADGISARDHAMTESKKSQIRQPKVDEDLHRKLNYAKADERFSKLVLFAGFPVHHHTTNKITQKSYNAMVTVVSATFYCHRVS